MGLFSGGNSRSSTTNNTSQKGQEGIEEDAIALQLDGDENQINVLDAGAIDAAFDFSGKNTSDVLALADKTINTNTAFSHEALNDAYSFADTVSSRAGDAIQQSSRAEVDNLTNQVTKLAVMAFGGFLLVQMITALRN